MKTKVCTKCKEPLPLAAFHAQKAGTYGVQSTCKECRKQHYQQNADAIKAASAQYYQQHLGTRRAYFIRYQASRKA